MNKKPNQIKNLRSWLNNLPNKLTFLRILSIPVIVVLFAIDLGPFKILSAFLFLASALTDFFDGYLARRYQLESKLGALIDPIADKLLVITGLVLLVSKNLIYAWVAILLIGRDVAVSGMRLIAEQRQFTIEVNQWGKIKTGLQLAAIFGIMLNQTLFGIPWKTIGMLCLWAALGFSLYSAYLYWLDFWEKSNGSSNPSQTTTNS